MKRNLLFVLPAVLAAGLVIAQSGREAPPVPPQGPTGTLNMATKIGSFKILGVANQPASGSVTVNFTGSVLISDLEGSLTVSPTLVKEYSGHGKQVYFGTGTITLNGKFRAIQWFGRDMSATWTGRGVIRLFGEFDKNLHTGDYWFDDPTRKIAWGQGGQTVGLPNENSRSVKPVERGKAGGTGGG